MYTIEANAKQTANYILSMSAHLQLRSMFCAADAARPCYSLAACTVGKGRIIVTPVSVNRSNTYDRDQGLFVATTWLQVSQPKLPQLHLRLDFTLTCFFST